MADPRPAPPRPPRARIAPGALAAILHARGTNGSEACGLLLGRATPEGVDVEQVVPTANAGADPTRSFLVDAADALRVAREARGRGLAVVGAWHAHPHGDARFSAADAGGLVAAMPAPTPEEPAPAAPLGIVVGRGAGRALVVRAYAVASPGSVREVELKALL